MQRLGSLLEVRRLVNKGARSKWRRSRGRGHHLPVGRTVGLTVPQDGHTGEPSLMGSETRWGPWTGGDAVQGEGLNLSQLQVRMPSTVLGGLHTSRPFYQNCPPKVCLGGSRVAHKGHISQPVVPRNTFLK